ncbi:MAG: hypothetical protein NVS3B3_20240 [Aquirhabdus sp.]
MINTDIKQQLKSSLEKGTQAIEITPFFNNGDQSRRLKEMLQTILLMSDRIILAKQIDNEEREKPSLRMKHAEVNINIVFTDISIEDEFAFLALTLQQIDDDPIKPNDVMTELPRNSSSDGQIGTYQDKLSRRKFLSVLAVGTGALTIGSPTQAISLQSNVASSVPLPLKDKLFLRPNISAQNFPSTGLDSYAAAVEAMLRLPPSHPHNWYRQALIHLLDCPHGNWWFLPWHRAYIGWFERICRHYSNDAQFALPYWDWTASQRMPASFFEGVLDVHHALFHNNVESFQEAMREPISNYWRTLTTRQLEHLERRGIRSLGGLLETMSYNFQSPARRPTLQSPDMTHGEKKNTGMESVRAALAPRIFEQFGSGKTEYHQGFSGMGIFEGVPHGTVHFFVAGTMTFNLSPVDPVFLLHHANVDRIWGLWEMMQQEEGLPSLPVGNDGAMWGQETFEFFCNDRAEPILNSPASLYSSTENFGYSYEPASPVITRPPTMPQFRNLAINARIEPEMLSFDRDVNMKVLFSPAYVDALERGAAIALQVVMQAPRKQAAWQFDLWIESNDNQPKIKQLIGQHTIFGSHDESHHNKHLCHIGVSNVLQSLHQARRLNFNAPIVIHIGAKKTGYEKPELSEIRIQKASLEIY